MGIIAHFLPPHRVAISFHLETAKWRFLKGQSAGRWLEPRSESESCWYYSPALFVMFQGDKWLVPYWERPWWLRWSWQAQTGQGHNWNWTLGRLLQSLSSGDDTVFGEWCTWIDGNREKNLCQWCWETLSWVTAKTLRQMDAWHSV